MASGIGQPLAGGLRRRPRAPLRGHAAAQVAGRKSTTAPAKLAYLQPVLPAVASQRIVGRREA